MGKLLSSQNVSRILAVFLAIILWLFVTGDNITRTASVRKIITGVPLSYENLQPGLAVMKMPQTVDMTLEGVARAFDELLESDLEAYLDLSGLEAGAHQVQVRGKAAHGLTLVSLAPRQVEVIIEVLQSRPFPVEIEFSGDPLPGWSKQSHSFRPQQVYLEAVPSILDEVARVVVHVDLNERHGIFELELAPQLLTAAGGEISGVTVTPPKIAVTVNLIQADESGEASAS